eukprot:PhM_4_TR16873/c0_g1_i1/m.91226
MHSPIRGTTPAASTVEQQQQQQQHNHNNNAHGTNIGSNVLGKSVSSPRDSVKRQEALPPLPRNFKFPPRDPSNWGGATNPSGRSLEDILGDFIRSGASTDYRDAPDTGYTVHPEERCLLAMLAEHYHGDLEETRARYDLERYTQALRFPNVQRYKYLSFVDPKVENKPPVPRAGPEQMATPAPILPPHLATAAANGLYRDQGQTGGYCDTDYVGTWRVREEGSMEPVVASPPPQHHQQSRFEGSVDVPLDARRPATGTKSYSLYQ